MKFNPQLIVTIVIVVGLLAFRIYRQSREQRWKIGTLWAAPVVLTLVTVLVVAQDVKITALAVATALAGLAVGTAVGFYQGTHTRLRVDKPNKLVLVKIAPFGIALFVVIIGLRLVRAFSMLGSMNAQAIQSGAIPAVTPAEAMVGSGLLALAAGTVIGLRWYVQRAFDAAPEST